MVKELNGKSDIKLVENKLSEAQDKIKEAIDLSLREAGSKPSTEDEILSLWSRYASSLNDYFVDQAEKSGNNHIGKRVVKYMMFGKF